eukprot:3607009-Amphidinium_carterae.1
MGGTGRCSRDLTSMFTRASELVDDELREVKGVARQGSNCCAGLCSLCHGEGQLSLVTLDGRRSHCERVYTVTASSVMRRKGSGTCSAREGKGREFV